MKKLSFDKKLSLNKETVATLNKNQMSKIKGGDDATTTPDVTEAEAARLSWFRNCSKKVDCCPHW